MSKEEGVTVLHERYVWDLSSLYREDRPRPNSSFSEARCLQRKVWNPCQAWTPVLGVRADWLAPEGSIPSEF